MNCTCGNEHHSRACLAGQLDAAQAERDKALTRVEELEGELAEWKSAAKSDSPAEAAKLISDLDDDIDRLTGERDALAAEVERLRSELSEPCERCHETYAAGRREAFEELTAWANGLRGLHLPDATRVGFLIAMSYVTEHIRRALRALKDKP